MDSLGDSTMVSRPPSVITPILDLSISRVESSRSSQPLQDGSLQSRRLSAQQRFEDLFNATDPALLDNYFGEQENSASKSQVSSRVGKVLLRLSGNGSLRDSFDLAIVNDDNHDAESNSEAQAKVISFMEMEKKVQRPTGFIEATFLLLYGTVAEIFALQQ